MTVPIEEDAALLTLHQLVRTRMDERGWSYTDLERRSNRALSRGRWQQLGSGVQQKKFPDPASLVVIADVLEVNVTTVVLAAAQSLGLDARLQGHGLANLLPPGTEQLSEPMRDALLSMIRVAVAEALSAPDAPGQDAVTDETAEWPTGSAPLLRSVKGSAQRGEA